MDSKLISKYRAPLMGAAMISVMLFHYFMDMESFVDPTSALFLALRSYRHAICSTGVDIFVFLAGMGLYFSFSGKEDLRGFYSRRILRLVVPYCLIAAVFWYIRVILVNGQGKRMLLKNFLFLTLFTDGVTTFWYIFLSIVMYALFPVFYYLFQKKPLRQVSFLLILILCFAAIIGMDRMWNEEYMKIYICIHRVPGFLIGIYCGKPIKEGRKIPLWAVWAYILLAGVFWYGTTVADTPTSVWHIALGFWGFAEMLLLTLLFSKLPEGNPVSRVFGRIGKYTLELYMIHVAVRNLLAATGHTMDVLGPKWILSVVLVFLLSIGFHECYDRALKYLPSERVR